MFHRMQTCLRGISHPAFPLLLACAAAWTSSLAAADPTPAGSGEKYDLKYKFQPAEVLRWQVKQVAKIKTTISGTTQTADTDSQSVKVWKVTEVRDDGTAVFAYSVESVLMVHRLTGRQEVRYDSQKDSQPPPGYEQVAESIGKPLTVVTMDARGAILHREDKRKTPTAQTSTTSQMTIPLPAEPVAVGHTWSVPNEANVTLKNGATKIVKTRQQYKLEGVTNGVAAIRVQTQILTPVDAALQAQLIQLESNGVVRFDIAAGRVVSQQMDADNHVVGFQGEASSLHYAGRFAEELLPATPATAQKGK